MMEENLGHGGFGLSIYAEEKESGILLTTRSGECVKNAFWLSPEVISNLCWFILWHRVSSGGSLEMPKQGEIKS